jgi:hypothetical protein
MTKKTKKATTKSKSNAPQEIKAVTLKTTMFGEVVIDKNKPFQKGLVENINLLFEKEKDIVGIIPTIAKGLISYIDWLKKNSPTEYKKLVMNDLKQYCFALVGYEKTAGIGKRKVQNHSFEHNVARACKIALLSNKNLVKINEDKKLKIGGKAVKVGAIVGMSKDINPEKTFDYGNGKIKTEKNKSKDLDIVRTAEVEDMFQVHIKGGTSNQKPKLKESKAMATPKEAKIKVVSIDEHAKKVLEKLQGLNSEKNPEKIRDNFKGTFKKICYEIAQLTMLQIAKQKTFETKENGKVISNNEVLVITSKFSEQLAWAKKSMDIDSLSQQPNVARK